MIIYFKNALYYFDLPGISELAIYNMCVKNYPECVGVN